MEIARHSPINLSKEPTRLTDAGFHRGKRRHNRSICFTLSSSLSSSCVYTRGELGDAVPCDTHLGRLRRHAGLVVVSPDHVYSRLHRDHRKIHFVIRTRDHSTLTDLSSIGDNFWNAGSRKHYSQRRFRVQGMCKICLSSVICLV